MISQSNTDNSKSDDASSRGLIPATIVRSLRCPACQLHLSQDSHRLYCLNGHSFDRAKQGHVSLRLGGRTPLNADSAAMVIAREALLDTGLYDPIRNRSRELIALHAPSTSAPIVADLAGGTGYYLSGILDTLPGSFGICVDLSTHALRRAAKCHPRAAAIGADLRDPLPLAKQSVSVATSFFGPRNVPEIERVLRDDGILAIVSPTGRHLVELVDSLGMLRVHESKDQRLAATLTDFTPLVRECLTYQVAISRDQARNITSMGPSAHHITADQLDTRIGRLPQQTAVTVSVNLGIYRPTRASRVAHA
jgi:23S rRNA (guanine745-N1)-methyltransferase